MLENRDMVKVQIFTRFKYMLTDPVVGVTVKILALETYAVTICAKSMIF